MQYMHVKHEKYAVQTKTITRSTSVMLHILTTVSQHKRYKAKKQFHTTYKTRQKN